MHETIGGPLGNWLAIVGVISLIYWGWRIVAAFQARAGHAQAPPAPAVPAAAVPTAAAAANDDIAVIAAAVHAMLGTHRIVHLERTASPQTWAIEGRWMQQTSHTPR